MDEDIIKEIENMRQTQPDLYASKAESLASICSCPKCDSLKCFVIRNNQSTSCKCSKKSTLQSGPTNSHKTKDTMEKPSKNQFDRIVNINDRNSYKTLKSNLMVDEHTQANFSLNSSPEICDRFYDLHLIKSLRDIREATAHLSAQVMNLNDIDLYKDSMFGNESEVKHLERDSNIREYVFTKLHEIYKACKCKVCECIPITPFISSKNTCSCKPCQCVECKKLYRFVGNHMKEKPHLACPCIACDKNDCQGIVKEWKSKCGCKPCDCVTCTKNANISGTCDCLPCACVECKNKNYYSPRTYIVASMGQTAQSDTCDCEQPCECPNCIPTYRLSGEVQERSTGTVSHSVCPCNNCNNNSCNIDGENCRCEMQKGLMTKPIQRDQHDYDIRNAFIQRNKCRNANFNKNVTSMSAYVHQHFGTGEESKTNHTMSISKIYSPNTYKPWCEGQDGDEASNVFSWKPSKQANKIIHAHLLKNVIASHCRFNSFNSRNSINCCTDDAKNQSLLNDCLSPHNSGKIIELNLTPLKPIPNDTASYYYNNIKHQNNVWTSYSKESYKSSLVKLYTKTLDGGLTLKKNFKERKRENTEIAASQHTIYCTASVLNNVPLFSDGASAHYILKKDSKYSKSLNSLLFLSPCDALSNLNEDRSLDKRSGCTIENKEADNIPQTSTIKFFNTIFTDNQIVNDGKQKNSNKDTFDYEKIKTTLNEAEEFSMKLKRMLHVYETANNNFVSVSYQLNMMYNRIVQNKYTKCTHSVHFELYNDNNTGDIKSLSSHEQDINAFSSRKCESELSYGTTDDSTLKPIFGNHNLLQYECIESQQSECEIIYRINPSKKPSSNLKFKCRFDGSTTAQHDLGVLKRDNKYTETDLNYTRLVGIDECVNTELCYKHHTKYEYTEITFKDADFYRDASVEINPTDISLSHNYLHNAGSWADVKYRKINDLSAVKSKLFQAKNRIEEFAQNNNDNSCNKIFHQDTKIIGIISQEIRKQMNYSDNVKSYRRPNIWEKKTYNNMIKILDKVVSLVVLKSELSYNKRKPTNNSLPNFLHHKTRSSIKNLKQKASFSDLRRISENTILVKWNTPNNINNIKGYEIQVDGLAVKKILNPKQTSAVVTYPQNDTIILTILTLTEANGPYNTNTVVYRPRKTR